MIGPNMSVDLFRECLDLFRDLVDRDCLPSQRDQDRSNCIYARNEA